MPEEKPPVPPARKPYVTPEVTKVALRPQEAVLGFCKTSGSSGVGGSSCMTASCQDLGS